MDIDPNDAIEYIFKHGKKFAKAKAERTYLEEYRKSLKAILMQQAQVEGHHTAAAQEREAYADERYQALLQGLKQAVEAEEEVRWGLVAAQARIDVWRSQESSKRQEIKAVL
jgi:conjugal transfer/entry exclusion protein